MGQDFTLPVRFGMAWDANSRSFHSTDITWMSSCSAKCRRNLHTSGFMLRFWTRVVWSFLFPASLLSSQFPFPRMGLQTASLPLAPTSWHLLLNQLLLLAADLHMVLCFPPWMSITYSGYFNLQVNDNLLLSCLFPGSHFHLIYSPITKFLYIKIVFLYHFLEHSSSFQACCSVVSSFPHISYSTLPSAFPCMWHPTIFGLVLKFSQICSFLFFPCFHLFLYHCIISCRFLLGKSLTKWGVCLCLPVGLTFFLHHKDPSLQKFLIHFPVYLLCLSHHISLYISYPVFIFPFILLDNKNMIKP